MRHVTWGTPLFPIKTWGELAGVSAVPVFLWCDGKGKERGTPGWMI